MTGNSNRVLLIEDDAVDRESVHRALGDSFCLINAEHGKEGLEIATRERPACALLDYRLPDIDGLEIVPELVAHDVPVIMMTSAGSESTAVEAMKAGAADYITKDEVTTTTLSNAITHAIDAARLKRKIREQREELENFVSAASHDLRAPIRHITAIAEFAKTDLQSDDHKNLDQYLDHIIGAGTRMTALLEALVEFARSGRSETALQPVDLHDAVKQATENLSIEIDSSNAVISYPVLPTVMGHAPSLIELMQNLIGNAIKYSGDTIPKIQISYSRGESVATILVQDNGIGIPEEFIESIFDPFRRLHTYETIEGSGIGLANCRRIVEHHGGQIWAQSTPGDGAKFFFTLHLASEHQT